MEKRESRIGNYLFSLLFITLGILMITAIKVENYELTSTYSLGPGFFPMWIAILMIGIGCLLLWFTYKGRYDSETLSLPHGKSLANLFTMTALTAGGIMLIEHLGMILTIALYFMSISRFVCQKSWKETVASTLVASAAIYIVFNICFKVKFPIGIFGF